MSESTVSPNVLAHIADNAAVATADAIGDEVEAGKEKARKAGGMKGFLFKAAEFLDGMGIGGLFVLILNFFGIKGDTLTECAASMNGTPIPKQEEVDIAADTVGQAVSKALTDPDLKFTNQAEFEQALKERIAKELRENEGDLEALKGKIDEIAGKAAHEIATKEMAPLFDADGKVKLNNEGMSAVSALAALKFNEGMAKMDSGDKDKLAKLAGKELGEGDIARIGAALAPALVNLEATKDKYKAGTKDDFNAVYQQMQEALRSKRDSINGNGVRLDDNGLDILAQQATKKFFETQLDIRDVPPEFKSLMAESERKAGTVIAENKVVDALKGLPEETRAQLPLLFGKEAGQQLSEGQLQAIGKVLGPEFLALNDEQAKLMNNKEGAFDIVSQRLASALEKPENKKFLEENGLTFAQGGAEVFANKVAESYVKEQLKSVVTQENTQEMKRDELAFGTSIAQREIPNVLKGMSDKDKQGLATLIGVKLEGGNLPQAHAEALGKALAPVMAEAMVEKDNLARNPEQAYAQVRQKISDALNTADPKLFGGMTPKAREVVVDGMTTQLLKQQAGIPVPKEFAINNEKHMQAAIVEQTRKQITEQAFGALQEFTAIEVYSASKEMSGANPRQLFISNDATAVMDKYYQPVTDASGKTTYELKTPLDKLTQEQRDELNTAQATLCENAATKGPFIQPQGFTVRQREKIAQAISNGIVAALKENPGATQEELAKSAREHVLKSLEANKEKINGADPDSKYHVDNISKKNGFDMFERIADTIGEALAKKDAPGQPSLYTKLEEPRAQLNLSRMSELALKQDLRPDENSQIRGGQNVEVAMVQALGGSGPSRVAAR